MSEETNIFEKLKTLVLWFESLETIKPDFEEIIIHPQTFHDLCEAVEKYGMEVVDYTFMGKRLTLCSVFTTPEIVYFGSSDAWGLYFNRIPISWYKSKMEAEVKR